MKKNRIEVVLFDFGGVLSEEGFVNGLASIARINNYDPEVIIREGFNIIYEIGYVVGKSDEQTFWQTMRDKTGIKGSDGELRDEIIHHFRLRRWMPDLVEEITKAGIRVGILSDQTNWLDELNKKYDFFKHFDYVFSSYHIGKSKRDKTVFNDVVASINVEADSVLFVDDNDGNCTRAKECGVNTIHYVNDKQFLNELRGFCPFVTESDI